MAFTPAHLPSCLYLRMPVHLAALDEAVTPNHQHQLSDDKSEQPQGSPAARQLKNANQRNAWTLPEPYGAHKESSGKLSTYALKDSSA